MSSDGLAVVADGIGKDYRLGELTDARRFLQQRVLRSHTVPRRSDFYALHDVSFEIRHGEAVAVVGSNGSGKSTLLQVMSGTTVPSEGRMEITGRVLPLLEVGAGFHPELTGHENVILFGTILGLKRREIREAVAEVSAFGEIDTAHMETPVKRFSLGMRARLSFAVAMSFPADIYIFDEVMSVVDDHFKDAAIERITQLHAAGRTVLFVSHDLAQVRQVCERALWLDRGELKMDAAIDEVAPVYSEFQRALERAAAPAPSAA